MTIMKKDKLGIVFYSSTPKTKLINVFICESIMFSLKIKFQIVFNSATAFYQMFNVNIKKHFKLIKNHNEALIMCCYLNQDKEKLCSQPLEIVFMLVNKTA